MTDDQWQALAPFAEADAKARQTFEESRAMNVPTDPRKRIEADLYFTRVRFEMLQAVAALEDARKRILGE